MGLTLHFTLKAPAATSAMEARCLIEKLQATAKELPFRLVTEVFELTGDACEFEHGRRDVPITLLLHGSRYLKQGEEDWISVTPTHLIGFFVAVGEGCEPADFGLALYPEFVTAPDGERMETGLTGWSWQSFCKTQYASNPKAGGQENFLRCHLNLIKMLDAAQSLGIVEKVQDEGEYWESRDLTQLCERLKVYNTLIAGFAGELKDRMKVEAPITSFPNFEHLEAEGRAIWTDPDEELEGQEEIP
ncbi:MAG: hypothetical protein ACR2FY_07540 [Pirellulaceae bacterium]